MKSSGLSRVRYEDRKSLRSTEKVSVRLTAAGWLTLFLLVWVPVAVTMTCNNFLFIIFGMVAWLVIVSHGLARRNIRSVRFTRKFPDEIFAGTRFSVRYQVGSGGRLKRGPACLVLNDAPPLDLVRGGVAVPYAPSSGNAPYRGEAKIESRGDCTIGPALLSSTFPFGLAHYVRRTGPTQTVLVFPRIRPVDPMTYRGGRGLGRSSERQDAYGTVPHHFREYVAGDPYKHIDWKKSARTGQLITRVISEEAAGEVTVRLPDRASEDAISEAASLVAHYGTVGVPVSLKGPGLFVEAGVGPAFTRKLLTILARWESSDPTREEGNVVPVGRGQPYGRTS